MSALLLSELLDWQQVLGVPLSGLVADRDSALSDPIEPVLDRLDTGEDDQFVTSDIHEHLVQLMLELENVAAGTFDWQAPCA